MRGVLNKCMCDDSECRYFGIIAAPEFSKKAYKEASSSPLPIRLSDENTIVKDVAEIVMGELIITEGVNSVIRRMGVEIDERMQRMKEEERGERKRLELRLERLEIDNEELTRDKVELRKEFIEAQKRVWQVGLFTVSLLYLLCSILMKQ